MEASETESGRGVVAEGGTFEQTPISDTGNHGSVTPSSAPPASAQSGSPLDEATKAGLAGTPPASGGPTP